MLRAVLLGADERTGTPGAHAGGTPRRRHGANRGGRRFVPVPNTERRTPDTVLIRGTAGEAALRTMRLRGMPVRLTGYAAESVTNRRFEGTEVSQLKRFYLPSSLAPLYDGPAVETREFIEDDNRAAILPDPVATLDGMDFYLSVKGVGSTVDPYSWRPLDRSYASELVGDPDIGRKLQSAATDAPDRIITGELWLRGSPYGGQGWEHATNALRVSERADLTNLNGFRIAPVVQVCFLPVELQERLRQIYWYRRYPGRMVQELRLVPSNVRLYFHSKTTVGNDITHLFDQFSVRTSAQALTFEVNYLRTTVAMLTLFARTLVREGADGPYRGLDFHDVWLDKDAVLAPDGSVYFVDLEGIEEVAVSRSQVIERIEDQIYRTLYELTFAYEQIERERARRFGTSSARRSHFESVLRAALRDDPFVRLGGGGAFLEMEIRNNCQEEALLTRFRMLDG